MNIYDADKQFEKSAFILPPSPDPLGLYKPCLIDGKHLYISGHGPVQNDGTLITGRVGQDVSKEDGKLAARQAGLAILSTLKKNLGNLNRIKRIVKLFGMVNCIPEFDQHPYIINGCSELFAEVWGPDNGVGVRSAVGFVSLPSNMTVEIEAVFELYE